MSKLLIKDHLLLNIIEFILERSPTSVKNVGKILIEDHILMPENSYWREDINVKNVAKLFITDHLLLNTIKFILVRSPTIVKNVSKIFIKKHN